MMSKLNDDTNETQVYNFMHFLEMPLKIVGCWDWYEKPRNNYHVFVNNTYLSMVLFILANLLLSLIVHLYTEWVDTMSSLDKMADGLPLLTSVAIVAYFSLYKQELYDLIRFMNENFKCRSARGLTNTTMLRSYRIARNFAYFYTACTVFSVTMYVFLPVLAHLWTKQPLQPWIYLDVTRTPFIVIVFLRQCIAQAFVALALGQLGVFFAANSILLCGQLDLLCCSLRNSRYTALLQQGVCHRALVAQDYGIQEDEKHNHLYNHAQMVDSEYHYDTKVMKTSMNKRMKFDIYSASYDPATEAALRDCARVLQAVYAYQQRFERFVSPLLVLRVVQVTLYLCTLLYAATLKFDMITVEYLGAVALDIFVYCYFGNQIICQAERVATAAYQSAWAAAARGPRRALLALQRAAAARRALAVRAGRFLPMDLHTFVVIIKTSFSYYTLLVSVNEK
ncbi:putative odorant receptor 85e [Epargyreus clarus]|uniref:putative odorant receptor 85e n=1 Tax=Epargyreus clarus TaxID=520877 RepID=UPI003C2FD20B